MRWFVLTSLITSISTLLIGVIISLYVNPRLGGYIVIPSLLGIVFSFLLTKYWRI